MKNIFMVITAILIVLMVSSCDDIINSDENLNKFEIKYNYVLKNQTKSVIMPLHAGNNWIYMITKYDIKGNIESQSFDTISVTREIKINNEIWFEVINSMYHYTDSTVMVNTDLGLWYKCNPCDSLSYLEAQYPIKNSPYYAGENKFNYMIPDSNDSFILISETIHRMAKFENVPKIKVPAGTFECIKYINWFESINLSKTYNPRYTRYYVPDLGMIKQENFVNTLDDTTKIFEIYELISYQLFE